MQNRIQGSILYQNTAQKKSVRLNADVQSSVTEDDITEDGRYITYSFCVLFPRTTVDPNLYVMNGAMLRALNKRKEGGRGRESKKTGRMKVKGEGREDRRSGKRKARKR